MRFEQKEASETVSSVVRVFWTLEGDAGGVAAEEKIIPDGYPEMIFHCQTPFQTNLTGQWVRQEKYLVAGQIRNCFMLQHSGRVKLFAITFQPWALSTLFGVDMSTLTHKVSPIDADLLSALEPVRKTATGPGGFDQKVEGVEAWFKEQVESMNKEPSPGEKAVRFIIQRKGSVTVEEVLKAASVSQRTLERYFKSHIGLSPKYYSRIIRFARIFELAREENNDWLDLVYQVGFYDQPHFIKNFKEFSGVDPTGYGFTEESLANFLLRR